MSSEITDGGSKPFLSVDWCDVVFLHFGLPARLLQPLLPRTLELDLFQGQACLSLVALTVRRFRPESSSCLAWPLRLLTEQRLFNVRTYVRAGQQPGALFLQGWFGNRWRLPWTARFFDLPYRFGSLTYDHSGPTELKGQVVDLSDGVVYVAKKDAAAPLEYCPPGSLAEFALERYTGWFAGHHQTKVLHTAHPRWLQTPLSVSITDGSLLNRAFPWFDQGVLLGAHYSPGFKKVASSRPERVPGMMPGKLPRRHVLSSFYDFP